MKTFESKTQNGIENYKKSNTFIDESHMTFHHVEMPYKTCRKWRLFEPKSQNGIENDQKSITFIDKFYMTFRHVEKPCKTNGKRGFSKAKNALRKPL